MIAAPTRRHLSRHTRERGLAGVAAARKELEAARRRLQAREEARRAAREAQQLALPSVA